VLDDTGNGAVLPTDVTALLDWLTITLIEAPGSDVLLAVVIPSLLLLLRAFVAKQGAALPLFSASVREYDDAPLSSVSAIA